MSGHIRQDPGSIPLSSWWRVCLHAVGEREVGNTLWLRRSSDQNIPAELPTGTTPTIMKKKDLMLTINDSV